MGAIALKISVIIPCHNAGPWVEAALTSVTDQTVAPYEIIVVNDASTDDSVEKIQSSGVPVQLIHAKCGSPAGARNVGIRHATGDWLAYLDADDYWYPNHLQEAKALLETHDDVAYMSRFDRCYAGGMKIDRGNPWPIKVPTNGLADRQFVDCLNQAFRYYMSTTMQRRDRVNEVGGFDEDLVRREDFELWLRVIHNRTWTFNPIATACQRHDTPDSNSRADWPNACYYMLKALLKNTAAYEDTPPYKKIVRFAARQAMSVAILSGTRDDSKRAKRLGWPYLTKNNRLVFSFGSLCPPLYRFGHQLHQRLKPRSTRPPRVPQTNPDPTPDSPPDSTDG